MRTKNRQPLVSIVIETGTRKTTGRISFEKMVHRYLAEVRRTVPAGKYELLFVGDGRPDIQFPPHCRFLDRPGIGYYGFKNEGCKAAKGDFVVFWDSDCRIKPGYLKRLLELYRKDPKVIGVAGRSFYDRSHLLSRVNTIIGFGPFCRAPRRLNKLSAISHNVSIRRSAYPAEPFGPFTGRTGGDIFITQFAVKARKPLLFDPRLEIIHEDVTTHLEALFERILRDLFTPLLSLKSRSKWMALAWGFWNWPILSMKRLRRLLIYRKAFGMCWFELPGALLVLVYFAFLEFAALMVFTFRPSIFMRWLNFQFGRKWIKNQRIG